MSGRNGNRPLLLILLTPLLLWRTAAGSSQTLPPPEEPPLPSPRHFQLQGSLQNALEYDGNVLKTFQRPRGDGLFRLLLKLNGQLPLSANNHLGTELLIGGKKFFRDSEQDAVLQEFTPRLEHRFREGLDWALQGRLKTQWEREKRDLALIDVNEDYLILDGGQTWHFPVAHLLSLSLENEVEQFNFGSDRPFDYLRQRHRLELRKSFSPRLSHGLAYTFTQQLFSKLDRDDLAHAATLDLRYFHLLLLQFAYTFQHISSSEAIYDYNNHRLELLLTWPIDVGQYLVTLNLMGTLQLKKYPAVYVSDEEGQRLLLTDAEHENFNSLVIKLSGKIVDNFSWEAKFSRYSNELSTAAEGFSRLLAGAGVRYDF